MERSQAIGIAEPREASVAEATPMMSSSEVRLYSNNNRVPLHAALPEIPAVPLTTRTLEGGRVFDVAMAAFLLLVVLPLMCICAVVVLTTSRGPLFYRQPRIGRNGKTFNCLKFRTMVEDADGVLERILTDCPQAKNEWAALQKIKSDPRVTPAGIFMRRYCLDELPQIFNVLAGDMSVVGPRPIVAGEIDRFGVNFVDYCSVKPGITGLWQVSGRHLLSYQERVALDAEYARSKSLSLDLLILWKTIPIVLLGQNG